MTFPSILFARTGDRRRAETSKEPAFFADLNLDQVITAITASRHDYNLKPFFYTPLTDIDAIRYRHEILHDLADAFLLNAIKAFGQKMRDMREYLTHADKAHYKLQKERWFLGALALYCSAVAALSRKLTQADLQSRGLMVLCDYLEGYVQSAPFASLAAETNKLQTDLSAIKYCLTIRDSSISVRKYEAEPEYSAEIEATFDRFKQGAVKNYLVEFSASPDMNHVEVALLDLVAKLYPEIFARLDKYYSTNGNYLDEGMRVFDQEIQFYLAYLEYLAVFQRAGLIFCYPDVSDASKEVYASDTFDLALASMLIAHGSPIVCNDFYLQGKERIFVVSGPNQGGKTTFARTFGQLHYLASLGCPVPGKTARLFLFDRLFTHFEKEERAATLHGKLEDELVRIHHILTQATARSIIIINEIFSSTTVSDAVFLGRKIMERIMRLDMLCVCVTFMDELASLGEKTVSLMSTIVPDNPALRTYKIVRQPADGLAYAMVIAEKYRLTCDSLRERITS